MPNQKFLETIYSCILYSSLSVALENTLLSLYNGKSEVVDTMRKWEYNIEYS